MLAYYVEWHMKQALAPMLFEDHDREAAEALRESVVAPAKRSMSAMRKIRTGKNIRGVASTQLPNSDSRSGHIDQEPYSH